MGGDPMGDAPIDDMGGDDMGGDKPFDDEPFDAGVEVDEESDPKKFIEQLTGKLGQSLRKYNEQLGQPDFELEKFAINSLLSATHTSEMDAEDQKDIINKVKSSGQGDEDVAPESDMDTSSDEEMPMDTPSDEEMPMDEPSDEELSEVEKANPQLYPKGWKDMDGMFMRENMDNLFVNPKKNNMFQPGSNDKLKEGNIEEESNEGLIKMAHNAITRVKGSGYAPTAHEIQKWIDNHTKSVNENLLKQEKSSIFGKKYLKNKLEETFNQDDTMTQPMTEPAPVVTPTKPADNPITQPSRKNKPFLPMPEVTPDPKAIK